MNEDAAAYSKLLSYKLKDFCKPLNDYFGISLFAYFKVLKDARYLMLSNDSKFSSYYLSEIKTGNIFFREYIYKKQIHPRFMA